MEIILIILDLVEDLLYSYIPLQCQTEISTPTIAVAILYQEEDRLHVFKICTRTRSVFLNTFN